MVPDHPELYAMAKKITLEAGYPYTDPRTLKTTQPPKTRKNKMPNSKKIPKWVLLDQIHVDVNIKSDMSPKARKELKSILSSASFHSLIQTVITGADRNSVKVTITR
jgi:hypothetical protein